MIVRNFYYEQGILAPYTSSIPIICVGNLVFGGAGKTPHVRYCADILSPKQPQGTLWLLSRGYKRKSRGLSVFAPEHGPEKLGDEAFWLATTTGLPLLVDRNRVRAVKYLETRKPTPTLILMDDGFQHRALKASCYLLLITYADASFTKSLVSLKCFRESMRGMRRAQVIVITRCPPILEPTKKVALLRGINMYSAPNTPVFFSHVVYGAPQPFGNTTKPYPSVVLLTGIANHKPLSEQVRKTYRIVKHFRYADHINYQPKKLLNIKQLVATYPFPVSIFTTEKDYVKIAACISVLPVLGEVSWFYVPINVSFGDEDDAFNACVMSHAR